MEASEKITIVNFSKEEGMNFLKGHHPGAEWRKTDLQVHSPRDPGWQGPGPITGTNQELEKARDDWADQFVSECLRRGLGAIGITDHHDIVMYQYVERAIARSPEAKDRLWLFPGMEVTCDDSVQCLILFDQGTPSDVLRRLFGIMPKIHEPSPEDAHAPQAQPCGKDIKDFLGAIFEDASFKGRCIVLPHASKGGHKDILRKGFHSRFADLQVDGVYNEKAYSDLDESTKRKIYGVLKDWGDRRHGIITTGDNRHSNYEHLGLNSCWIRIGEPTSEAIRQAVLADEARITYTPPSIPSQRVLELRVSSTLTGDNFALTFNDGFNALIGGRGSGKTAILEYLRFGLGRSIVDTTEDVISDRERDLIKSTLLGGYVEVDLERDGVRETWRRTLDKQAYITISTQGTTPIELPISSAQERFRSRAFSQKQLSTLVRSPDTADEQITGIAAAEWVDLRRQAEKEIEDAERNVNFALQHLVQGWAVQATFEHAVATTTDLKRRVAVTRERLEREGLSESQQAILDEAPIYARIDNQFQLTKHAITDKLAAITEINEIDLNGWEQTPDFPEINQAKEVLTAANKRISQIVSDLREVLKTGSNDLSIRYDAFRTRYADFKIKYEDANTAQSQLGSLLADYKRLTKELEQAERNQQAADEARKKFIGADAKLADSRKHLNERLTALRGILNEAADRVGVMSTGILRARIEEESVPERYLKALVDLFERCGIRDLEQRCKLKVQETSGDGRIEWEQLVHRFTELRRARVNVGNIGEIDPNLINDLRGVLNWELTENQAKQALMRLDDARLARLLSAWAAPFIRFEYKDRGSYMAFERASPGQQASALLSLLLNQAAGTLIIDQPEDDLDNRIIMSIVKLLQTTKQKRQLIFTTHNPNFVVNGDADKIVVLAPSVDPNTASSAEAAQITIEIDGAIETHMVRKAITDTMEGGREAFELRGRKYAFAPEDSFGG